MTITWLTRETRDVPTELDWLTPAERVRLAELRIKPRRDDWLLGRWTAKLALGVRLGAPGRPMDPTAIEIRAASDGAPEAIVDGIRAPWAISISHRAGRGLCAVAPAGAAMGCDLEWVVPRDPALVADFFAPEEQEAVARAAAHERAGLVALFWSGKESALKALRSGLREDPRDVIVRLAPDPPAAGWRSFVVRQAPGGRNFTGWWRELDDFVLTIAVDGSSLALETRPTLVAPRLEGSPC